MLPKQVTRELCVREALKQQLQIFQKNLKAIYIQMQAAQVFLYET